MIISWGIIGAGDIAAKQVAPAIRQAGGHQLVAVMRRDPAAALAFAKEHGAQRAYDSATALLHDDQVNAVYVATPPNTHRDQVVQAAKHGKHILCEKPMALSAAEAREMIDACDRHGVQLMLCYYQRFNARHRRVKALLEEKAIGQVTAARFNFSSYHPPRPGSWRHVPAISGGGPLMDLAPHCIDLLRYLCGPVQAVTAMVDTLAADSPVEDTATLLLRLHDGIQAVITTHWSTANHTPNEFNRFELHGTKGIIVAAPHNAKDSSGRVRLITADGEQEISLGLGGPRPHVAMLEAFGEAVAGGCRVAVSGQEGLASLQVIEAAYESARTGQTVLLD